jgi:uncharacterized protein (TIRG00374 family)
MEVKGRKKKILKWMAIVLFLLIIIVMFSQFGRGVIEELADLRVEYLLLALACGVGVQLTWGLKFFLLVKRRVKNAWFPFVLLSNMYGNFINITTPSGRMAGEPLRARSISKKYHKRFSTVFAAAMMDKMTLTLAMLFLLVPLTIYMTYEFDMPEVVDYFLGAFVLFWFGVGIVSYLIFKGMGEGRSRRIGETIYRISKVILRGKYRDRGFFIEKVKNGILEFKRSFKLLSKDPIFMVIDLSLGCMVYLFRFAGAYMFFLAVGHSQPFFTVSTVVMIAFIVGLISQLPGMVGIGESTMYGLYIATGVRQTAAITVSLLTQLNVYIFEIGLGYMAMLAVNIWTGMKRSSP